MYPKTYRPGRPILEGLVDLGFLGFRTLWLVLWQGTVDGARHRTSFSVRVAISWWLPVVGSYWAVWPQRVGAI
eukprot:4017228-Lingulodinium_polyedra.AAC.1